VVNINNTSVAPLGAGTYTLIAANGGSVSGPLPSSVAVTSGGLAPGTSALLVTNGSGALNLVVTASALPAVITGINVSGTTLTLNASNGADGGQFVLMEASNLAPPVVWVPVLTNNFNGSGNLVNFSTNILNPGNAQEFFLLQMP
jgi:hypothetical protein